MSSPHRPCRFVAGPFTRGLLCATTLAMALAAAQQNPTPPAQNQDPDQEDPGGLLSGNDLFPDNSILKGVILPTFDLNSRLTNTLTAEELTIVTKKKIEAKNLKIDFFGPDRTPRGTMSLKKSFFDAVNKMLTTKEPVAFVSDDLNVDGSSLAFDTEGNRGYLYGPVTAVSKTKPKTAANAAPGKESTAQAATLAPAPAPEATAEAVAETPAPAPAPVEDKDPLAGLTTEEKMAKLKLSKDQLQQIKAEAASRAPQVEEAQAQGELSLTGNKEKAEGARMTMNSFFQAAALTMLLAEAAPEPSGPVPRPVMEEPKEGTEKTTITSDGGAFIDNTEGLIIFLKNVKVVNPEFTMTAQKEVKAFMKENANSDKTEAEQREEYMKKAAAIVAARQAKAEAEKNGTAAPDPNTKESEPALPAAPQDASKPEKPEKPAPTPEQLQEMIDAKAKRRAEGPAGASDIRLLIASGTVLIDYKPKPPENKDEKPKEPVKAAAHLVVYNFDDEEILLQGGSPWVMIGTKLAAVDGEDSFIRVTLKDGRPIYAVTEGGSLKAELELDSMKDKEKDKDKAKPKEGDKAKPQGGGKPQNGPKPANNGPKPNNR